MDIFQDIDSNLLQLENASDFVNNNEKELLQNQIKDKIEEFERARSNELYNDFMNAFSYSNFFKCEDKEDNKNIYDEENSKNSTISQLTNDDSFEREISDEEQVIKKDFIHRKRIRNRNNDKN